MKTKDTILLVEDDRSLGLLMNDFLTDQGYDVVWCKDGIRGYNSLSDKQFDLAILDVMLPGMDGFTLAEKIRARNKNLPIIMVTARGMKEDKIKGFYLGADDYITKPFDEDEMLCRIKAVLNRAGTTHPAKATIYTIGSFTYDPDNLLLSDPTGEKRLTKKENELLLDLVLAMNSIVKRDDLLRKHWTTVDYFSGRSMDVYISRLRKYLLSDPEILLESIPKVGYKLQWNKK